MKSARPTRVATRRSNVGCSPNNSVTAGIRKNSHMFQISHNRMRERISGSGNPPVLFGLLVCVLFNSYTLSALHSTRGNCCLHSIFETTRIVHRFWLHSTTKPGVYLAYAIQRPVGATARVAPTIYEEANPDLLWWSHALFIPSI